jgi:hypothetical protein
MQVTGSTIPVPATTDPGTFWLRNLMNPQGTAIVKQGQYIGSHGIGMHRGKYLALTQKRPLLLSVIITGMQCWTLIMAKNKQAYSV